MLHFENLCLEVAAKFAKVLHTTQEEQAELITCIDNMLPSHCNNIHRLKLCRNGLTWLMIQNKQVSSFANTAKHQADTT